MYWLIVGQCCFCNTEVQESNLFMNLQTVDKSMDKRYYNQFRAKSFIVDLLKRTVNYKFGSNFRRYEKSGCVFVCLDMHYVCFVN